MSNISFGKSLILKLKETDSNSTFQVDGISASNPINFNIKAIEKDQDQKIATIQISFDIQEAVISDPISYDDSTWNNLKKQILHVEFEDENSDILKNKVDKDLLSIFIIQSLTANDRSANLEISFDLSALKVGGGSKIDGGSGI